MTAIALKSLDREPRTQAPHTREPADKREFANLVEKQKKPSAKETTQQLLQDNGPAARDALHLLLQQIPPAEMPHGGIPEAIATEVSVVIDLPEMLATELPEMLATETDIALASSIADFLPRPPVDQQALPMLVEDELSDGIPVAIEAGPRPKLKKLVDEEVLTMAVAIPLEVRQSMQHARTELQLPIVDGAKAKPITGMIPDAVPVLPTLVAKLAPTTTPIAEIPLTPLEQAVQELIAQVGDRDDKIVSNDVPAFSSLIPEVKLLSVEYPDAPTATPVREPRQAPELTNPSHVHLVIDDGAERVVVTVAVRGSEVNVALRGQDDATTAALARNAGSLDHAMRARGLDLASLMTGRDPDSQQQRPDREQPRDRNGKQTFSLEELA